MFKTAFREMLKYNQTIKSRKLSTFLKEICNVYPILSLM